MYITAIVVFFFSFNSGWTHSRYVRVASPELSAEDSNGCSWWLSAVPSGICVAASNFCWTAGLGHRPGLMIWAWAARPDSRARESTWMAFMSPSQPVGIDQKKTRDYGAFRKKEIARRLPLTSRITGIQAVRMAPACIGGEESSAPPSGHLQRIMCEWTPAAVDVSLFTSDLSQDVLNLNFFMLKKKKRDQGLRSCVNYPNAAGNTWKYDVTENACDYIDLPIDGIPSLKMFITALLGSFCPFHGFVILKNWVNLRNQHLNRICERKRGKASIL